MQRMYYDVVGHDRGSSQDREAGILSSHRRPSVLIASPAFALSWRWLDYSPATPRPVLFVPGCSFSCFSEINRPDRSGAASDAAVDSSTRRGRRVGTVPWHFCTMHAVADATSAGADQRLESISAPPRKRNNACMGMGPLLVATGYGKSISPNR
jgi:hypothetical protein